MELFPILFPVAVILETLSIWILNGIVWKPRIGLERTFLIVLGANVLSTLVGIMYPNFMESSPIHPRRDLVNLVILYVASMVVALAVCAVCLKGVRFPLVVTIFALANLVSCSFFAVPYVERCLHPDPRLFYHKSVSNLEMARSALSQYAADQDDGCYPPTESIGSNLEKLTQTLGNYGLVLPKKLLETGWSKLDYVRDPKDCTLYTFTVEVGREDVLRASPGGLCCDDMAPTELKCSYKPNILRCSEMIR